MHVVWHSYLLQSKFSPINVTTAPPPLLALDSNFFRASLIYFFGREVLQFRALRIFRSRRASSLSLPFPSVSKPAGKVAIKKAEDDFRKTRHVWPACEKWENIVILIKERRDICILLSFITTVRVSEDCVIVQSIYTGLHWIISNRTVLS